MASTERTRSISGSGGGMDDVTEHHHHHPPHHHQHHPQQQPTPPPPPQPSSSSNDYAAAAVGNMNLFQNFASNVGDANSSSAMNLSQISAASSSADSTTSASMAVAGGRVTALSITHNIGGSYCRFPKLEECAHFHYERVHLGQILLRLIEDRSDQQSSSNASQHEAAAQPMTTTTTGGTTTTAATASGSNSASNTWFIIRVTTEKCDPFLIRRSLENLRRLDEWLHQCVYDRKVSGLKDFNELLDCAAAPENLQLENLVAAYLNRFSNIMTDSLTCGSVLTWFQLDNKGRRLPLADTETRLSINTPAVGAAYGIRKYTAQAVDEISIEVGDMISVIDMPSPAESTWWRGKKSHLQKSHYEVGFFPQSCVATFGEKVPRNVLRPHPRIVGPLAVSPTKPVLRKHGKLIAFFRSFILSRPSRRRLKQTGIYKERVFSCDLSEHLLNSGQEIPMVLRCCAEFIEESGTVDGIYRLSGITSNIQKLRRSFDEERIPDFSLPDVRQDIHAMSSLLKMYFRELPNPLCTFQLYDNFVDAIQTRGDAAERLRLMKETVQKLPPPHYRTLKYLAKHLNEISRHHKSTGMTDRNLAIVWAPNLLRSPALETGDDYFSGVAALRGVGVQAVVTEYLITNCSQIFDSTEDYDRYDSLPYDSLPDNDNLPLEQRDHHDHSMFERPKSLSVGGPKLISLEEAQTRRSCDATNRSLAIATSSAATAGSSSYIEVGGGPSSLPEKYHTELLVPRSWPKSKPNSWRSLFWRNQTRSSNGADLKHAKKAPIISHPCPLDIGALSASSASATTGGGGGCGGSLAGTSAETSTHISLRNGHEKVAAAKSIDLYDGKQPMDVCVHRSASIESLRTVGHSRSVSHDSYFDILQSPLRSGAGGTCVPGGGGAGGQAAAARELSELGLNFDREEPEMRIFSESESLVSSPRVGKEMSRRSTTRSRPDTHTGNGNNPSPKKQPRLNIPGATAAAGNLTDLQWCSASSTSVSQSIGSAGATTVAGQHDESMCKRYKLEDQLSDIQYIDCSTPEHTVGQSTQGVQQPVVHGGNTIYASVQIHNPPRSDSTGTSRSSGVNIEPAANAFQTAIAAAASGGVRYSYPGLKSRNYSPDAHQQQQQQQQQQLREERFSYPGMGRKFTHNNDTACDTFATERAACPGGVAARPTTKNHLGRFSYCDPATAACLAADPANALARSNSADMAHKAAELARSKLSLPTPSTPGQSPRYSLLVGETSSECSSAVCTPVCDMDVSQSGMLLPPHSGPTPSPTPSSSAAAASNRSGTKDQPSDAMSTSCPTPSPRDIAQMKRELSLDLTSITTPATAAARMAIDTDIMSASTRGSLQAHQQQQQRSTPNTPNQCTTETSGGGNTSQSVTPSEFGYHHLSASRQSNAVSPALSLLSSPKSPTDLYETMERSFGSASQQAAATATMLKTKQVSSPIRSTINITYNLRSPGGVTAAAPGGVSNTHENVFFCSSNSGASTLNTTRAQTEASADYELVSVVRVEAQHQPAAEEAAAAAAALEARKPLLETSFDENMVYEQVKFFKGAVSEINTMLLLQQSDNGNHHQPPTTADSSMEADSSDGDASHQFVVPQLDSCSQATNTTITASCTTTEDQSETPSLTATGGNGGGVGGGGGGNSEESTDADVPMHDQELDDIQDSLELDPNVSLYENVDMRRPDSVYENVDLAGGSPRRQPPAPSTFNVRQLANKFESTSPVDEAQSPAGGAFDFARPFGRRLDSNRNASFGAATIGKTSERDVARMSDVVADGNGGVAKGGGHILHGAAKHTRSLDENAFVREFGTHKTTPGDHTKSVQLLGDDAPAVATVLTPVGAMITVRPAAAADAIDGRRMSLEFTRPKTLNPPKRLPDLDGCEAMDALCKAESSKLKLDLLVRAADAAKFERITPTTENPISLIQHNVSNRDSLEMVGPRSSTLASVAAASDDDRSSVSSGVSAQSGSAKVQLGSCKLDRERIEKIKEERRLQLNEKFRGAGGDVAVPEFGGGGGGNVKSKSKSRIELRELKDDPVPGVELRFKSKSRGDVRSMRDSRESLNHLTTMSTANTGGQQRVRRISDEKNQNDCIGFGMATAAAAVVCDADGPQSQLGNSVSTKARKFDGSKGLVLQQTTTTTTTASGGTRLSMGTQRERISPQFNIRDVAAMFESRSQQ